MDYRSEIVRMIEEIPYEFILRYLWLFVKDVYEDVKNRGAI